ncbi:alpha/beta hydrolase [Streptomyces sp. NPDC052042]|uniref:alpha/beta hydrolase n=1 Tax=Streptomyces sp. NPDC052042 TaxID=3365683 RepID=UPI0037CFCA8D
MNDKEAMNVTESGPGGPARRAARLLAAPVGAVRGAVHGVRHAYRLYHPPQSRVGRTPENKGLSVRPMRVVTSRDRIPLAAWVVPGKGPHTVVVCHGVERSRSSTLGHIEMLHRAGHHVVAYDMRNHGESGGDRRIGRMAVRYTSDLLDVLRSVAADPEVGGGRLAVLGFSFSAWPALYVLREAGPPVSAVITDSGPMFDIPSGLGAFADLRRGSLPEHLRAPVAFGAYRWAFRTAALRMLGLKEWPPDLSHVPARLMFVAGGEDFVVPQEQVGRVARCFPGAEFWVAPHAMHMNAIRFDRQEYRTRVLEFLSAAFAAGDEPSGEVVPLHGTEGHGR